MNENLPSLGLYLHVPFCATTCDFCAFHQNKPASEPMKHYVQGVKLELDLMTPDRKADTVFWGGGTPGLLPPAHIEDLGTLFKPYVSEGAEWSVELSPATVNPSKLKALKAIGVNRISMGVQSFNERTLERLGRDHNPEQVLRAYEMVRSEGFDNVNLDLMFAIPGQTDEQWEEDMRAAIRLEPEHLSTYCLTFEEDTALYAKLQEGVFKRSLEAERRLYLRTWEFLGAAGFPQYEVANFSKDGRACEHNMNTWRMQEWMGYGPSASSQWHGQRYTNIHDTKLWRAALMEGRHELIDVFQIDEQSHLLDCLIFGLRMNEGVSLEALKKELSDWPDHVDTQLRFWIKNLEEEEYAIYNDDKLILSDDGRLIADAIATDLIELFNWSLIRN